MHRSEAKRATLARAATGATREEVEHEMYDAIEFHIVGLRLSGYPVLRSRSQAAYCKTAA